MKLRALAIVTALALPALALAQTPSPPPSPSTPSDKGNSDKGTKDDLDKTNQKTTQSPGSMDKSRSAKLSEADVKIISHVHHVNQMETDLGKLAQKQGTASVKNYAEALERDHQGSDKDLMAFAKQHKLNAIPAEKPSNDAERQDTKDMTTKMAHLKTLRGAEFDREYLNMMASDHDKELAKIDTSASSASDPELQTMLKSLKPVLQRHADQARDLLKNSPQASADKSDKSMQRVPASSH